MKRSRFSEEQITRAVRQAEAGAQVPEICRQLGVSEATFCRWTNQYGGLGVSELRELRQLRDENRKLKGLVADLTLEGRLGGAFFPDPPASRVQRPGRRPLGLPPNR